MRSFGIALVGSVALTLVACSGSSDSAPVPQQTASIAKEGPSAECATGGTRITLGESSQIVCNGKDGTTGASPKVEPATLTNVEVEQAGANCVTGGVRLLTGKDTNGDGTLAASEVSATKFVCNGDARLANGANPVVSVFTEPLLVTNGTTAFTAQEATIKAPGKGKIIALSNMDAFCASPAVNAGYDCNAGVTAGYYTLSLDAAASPLSASFDYFYLTPNATENTARTAVFDVAAAGDVTVFVRARAASGAFGLWRRSLTLIFVPTA